MKKIIVVLSFLFLFGLAAEDIQVRVAVEGEHNTFKLKKDLENIAKEAAIKKYIAKLNSKTPAKLIEEACREYSNVVEGVQKVSSYTSSKSAAVTGSCRLISR